MKRLSFSFIHGQYPLGLSLLTFCQICFAFLILLRGKTIIGMFISLLNTSCSLVYIILELISCFLNRKRASNSSEQVRYSLSRPVTFYHAKKPINYHLILLFFLLALVSISSNLFHSCYLFNQLTFFSNIQAFAGIVFTWLFSFIFFRRKLLRHQMLGLALIAIMIIVYFAVVYKEAGKFIFSLYVNPWLFVVLVTVYVASESLREVIEKYLMQIHYVSHFLLLFTEGVLSLIVLLILSFSINTSACLKLSKYLFAFYLCKSSRWESLASEAKFFFAQGTMSILLCIAYILTYFFSSLMRILTNKKLSPTHRYISEIMFPFYYIVLVKLCRIFKNELEINSMSSKVLITEITQCLVIVIACFIYNEYIIIHYGKLDTETAQEITARAQNETEQIVNLINDNEAINVF